MRNFLHCIQRVHLCNLSSLSASACSLVGTVCCAALIIRFFAPLATEGPLCVCSEINIVHSIKVDQFVYILKSETTLK